MLPLPCSDDHECLSNVPAAVNGCGNTSCVQSSRVSFCRFMCPVHLLCKVREPQGSTGYDTGSSFLKKY